MSAEENPAVKNSRRLDVSIALWLALGAVALRVALPFLVSTGQYDGLHESLDGPYRAALRDHGFDYLWYSHVLPVLFALKDMALHNLFAADAVNAAGYFLVVCLDGIAVALAFLLMRMFAVWRLVALVVAAAISLRLLPWEVRDWGAGWDSFNPFLVMLFAWATARFALAPTTRRAWVAGACGTLLVGGFQFGLPIVAATAMGAAILLSPKRRAMRMAGCMVALPAALAAAVIAKNAIQHDLWSMSSGAGQNVFQNLNMALSDANGEGGLKLGIRNGYPDWWAWCYREAERRNIFGIPNVSGFYGVCMGTREHGYDFTALRAYLDAHPDPILARIVEKDLAILETRPWVWDSPVWERATGTSVAYGRISQRLLTDIAFEYPRRFAGRTYLNLTRHFLSDTRRFLVDLHRPRFAEPSWVRFLNRLFGLLFPVGFGAACIYFAATAARKTGALAAPRRFSDASPALYALGLVSAGFVATAAVSATMACCENHRHGFCYLPVAMCLGTILLRDAAVFARRITVNRGFR